MAYRYSDTTGRRSSANMKDTARFLQPTTLEDENEAGGWHRTNDTEPVKPGKRITSGSRGGKIPARKANREG